MYRKPFSRKPKQVPHIFRIGFHFALFGGRIVHVLCRTGLHFFGAT